MRTIVDLTDEQRAWLEAESRRDGISRAEAIRRLVDEARQKDRKARLRNALEAAAGSWTAGDGLEYQLRIRAEWDREWDPD
jgi:hypothetical protein